MAVIDMWVEVTFVIFIAVIIACMFRLLGTVSKPEAVLEACARQQP